MDEELHWLATTLRPEFISLWQVCSLIYPLTVAIREVIWCGMALIFWGRSLDGLGGTWGGGVLYFIDLFHFFFCRIQISINYSQKSFFPLELHEQYLRCATVSDVLDGLKIADLHGWLRVKDLRCLFKHLSSLDICLGLDNCSLWNSSLDCSWLHVLLGLGLQNQIYIHWGVPLIKMFSI